MAEYNENNSIDHNDLMKAYENSANKAGFLYMLLNLEAVQIQGSLISYIREILASTRQYERQYEILVALGLPEDKGSSGENIKETVCAHWEETPVFASQMDILWKSLGFDTNGKLWSAPFKSKIPVWELAENMERKILDYEYRSLAVREDAGKPKTEREKVTDMVTEQLIIRNKEAGMER